MESSSSKKNRQRPAQASLALQNSTQLTCGPMSSASQLTLIPQTCACYLTWQKEPCRWDEGRVARVIQVDLIKSHESLESENLPELQAEGAVITEAAADLQHCRL